ncbi:MAG: dipeptide/oligopeptide/nickel ABC transporter ATP-binding protein [Coriobacteriia bacterium]|nr:dipeptide/oligopeptide/nickel ABC transporter ATP-binding protein [Coriobacteriia bacterium]
MLLEASHITKTYNRKGSFRALDDVSIKVGEAESVGLIGPSGSGKSSLARIVAGLEQADSGQVTFQGITRVMGEHSNRSQRRLQRAAWLDMQMVFQNPEASFAPFMTIGQAVAEGFAYLPDRGVASPDKRIAEALDLVGLPSSFAKKHAFELSGGECQRAAIARAIVGSPALLICDEPTSALDVTVQSHVMDVLRHLREDLGAAFLFVSHDLALVNGFCDRVYRIESGCIVDELVAC